MGGNGSGRKPPAEFAKLRARIRRYRSTHPAASCAAIARKFDISRALAHKILRAEGLATRSQAAPPSKQWLRIVEWMRQQPDKIARADALGITRLALWRYELPVSDPRHREMPEGLRKRYKRLAKEQLHENKKEKADE